MKKQGRTIAKPVSYSGIGIHTGEVVQMQLLPAPAKSGIRFRRVDLPGQPEMAASYRHVVDTSRSTILGNADFKIHTVEHVLAAVKAFGIDNLIIELSNIEPPVGDGSSLPFVELIKESGVQEQDEEIPFRNLQKPVFIHQGDVSLVAVPHPTFKISYTLSYPGVPPLEAQFVSCDVNQDSFVKEIAPCRTFALYREISYLIDKGLIRGGSLSNANIILGEAILTNGGLRFPNEMARHKVLDLIGDLALVGFPFNAHIISIRSGHATHVDLARLLGEHCL